MAVAADSKIKEKCFNKVTFMPLKKHAAFLCMHGPSRWTGVGGWTTPKHRQTLLETILLQVSP